MGWLIAAAILVGLAFLPLGVGGAYNYTGYVLYFRVGPLKVKLLPRKRKPKKENNTKQKKESNQTPSKNVQSKKGGSWQDFYPLARLLLDFLGNTRRKLVVNCLEIKITMAADDPCDLAVNYGKACAIVGGVMPRLESLFHIKKRDVQVQCDFAAEKTLIFARLDATITLGRLLVLQCRYGIPLIREYLKIMNQRKGGAKI